MKFSTKIRSLVKTFKVTRLVQKVELKYLKEDQLRIRNQIHKRKIGMFLLLLGLDSVFLVLS